LPYVPASAPTKFAQPLHQVCTSKWVQSHQTSPQTLYNGQYSAAANPHCGPIQQSSVQSLHTNQWCVQTYTGTQSAPRDHKVDHTAKSHS
jgi:hypothetical protein